MHQNTLPSRAHSRAAEQQPFSNGSALSIDSSRCSSRRSSTPNLISPSGAVSRHAPDRGAAHLETCSLVDDADADADASETGSYAVREGARSLVDEPAHTPRSTQMQSHAGQQRPYAQSKSQTRPSLTQIQPARTVTLSRPQPQPQQQTPFQKPQQPVLEPQSQSQALASSGPATGTSTGRSSTGRAPKASEARWTPERDEVADALLNPSFLDHIEYVTCAAAAASNGVPEPALPSQAPPLSPHAVPLLHQEDMSALEAELLSPFGADMPLSARSNFSIGTFRVL